MKKGMCITYEVENSLYVNVTNRCSNRCDFCIRNNGDGAYGSESLWLVREPTQDEILESVFKRDIPKYKEIVFCGYGEPSYRLDEIRNISLKVKSAFPSVKIRINTNGQSDLILGKNTANLYRDAFDTVSISLNASNSEGYMRICHPVFSEKTFPAIIEFAKNVKNCVQFVVFSVVGDFLSEEEIRECQGVADSCGVPLRIREYIKNQDG